MKILICDKNKKSSDFLHNNLTEKYGGQYECKSVNDEKDFLNTINDCKNKFDVLIMNIEQNDTSGIDLAYVAEKRNPNLKTIFTSDDVDLVEDIYVKMHPYAYVNKPVNFDLLNFHLHKINKELSERKIQFFTINSRNTTAKIAYDDILYFESQKRKLFIHTINEVYTIYKKIDEIEEYAPDYFVRCHQSYLINPYYTKGAITGSSFELVTGQKIPISRARLAETQKIYFEFQENKFIN